jgi:signal transduction histidine kinase
MSLHRILSLFVIVVVALALGAAISLVVLTNYLHRTTLELETALQSVKLAEEMQIDLLNYIGTADPIVRARAEAELRLKLHLARQYVGSPDEEALLRDAERLTDAYFQKNREFRGNQEPDGDLEHAFEALRQFIDTNVEQAEVSMRESEHWDEMADRIGMGCSAMLIIGIAAMLSWLRRVAFEPVFDIQRAIREFASGHKQTRAPERGPEELRMIAKQFNDMTAALERQYENQLSFLAAVAHDLRNPISALKGSADILSAERNLPAETVNKIMSIIRRQVQGLDRMIGDLLDTSRIESGHLELRISECDARAIAQNAFDLFNSAARSHHLILTLPERPVHFRCDPLRIEQVLTNLVSNAVKYSRTGTRVELRLEEVVGEVRFRVTDQGLGIAEKDLQYIFEPFRRRVSSKDDVPGVGLGLSVAQRIVRAHGGRIHVESQVGKGTTFSVHLPAPEGIVRKLTA